MDMNHTVFFLAMVSNPFMVCCTACERYDRMTKTTFLPIV